ncbi:MAG: hypothetical protein PHY59_05265 [Methanobacterium sp.]|nr:hypothetical protein [Methanobacterium sp.]
MKSNSINGYGLKLILFLFIIILFIGNATAHQPRVVVGIDTTTTNPIIIENPDLMQAFYGNLNGKSDYYQINSNVSFELCLGITVPACKGLGGSLPSVQVTDLSGKPLFTLNGTTGTWKPFIGEFKDFYLDGPVISKNVSAGIYKIKVFNGNNDGKYLLIIGNNEMFNAEDILQDIVNAPILKEHFFGKPVTLLFLNFIGFLLAFGTLIMLFIMTLLSRKSTQNRQTTTKTNKILKPIFYIGIVITTILWLIIMFIYSLSILVITNTIFFIIAIIIGVIFINRISKNNMGKITILIGSITVILGCLFLYGAIIII